MWREWLENWMNPTRPNKFTRLMGQRIRQARQERELSQEELARRIYRRRPSLSDMENGKMEPDASTLVYLCHALDKPLLYFFPDAVAQRIGAPATLTPEEQEAVMLLRRLARAGLFKTALRQLRALADIED